MSSKRPELIPLDRGSGFNKATVRKFLLESIVEENTITGTRIFSMDEISHTAMQRLQKMRPQKDKRQVGDILSCEGGQNVSGVCAVIASRFHVPPMLMYPSKK